MASWYAKIGNSQVTLWDGKRKYLNFDTKDVRPKNLLSKVPKGIELCFFSVVPSLTKALLAEGRRQNRRLREFSREDIPIRSSYQNTLGIDRLMNVYAASLVTSRPLVVMDVGTALTVDFLNRECEHIGGWIAAGPHLCLRALHEYTAKLPLVQPRKTRRQIGQTTDQALQVGQAAVLRGMILEASSVARKYFGKKFDFFVTGGGASLIQDKTVKHLPNMALRGLKHLRSHP